MSMHNLHTYNRMCSYTHTYIQIVIYTYIHKQSKKNMCARVHRARVHAHTHDDDDDDDDYNNDNRIQRRNFLTAPRTVSNKYTQVARAQSCAKRVQHIMQRATWYKGTAQLLSLTEFKSHLFELFFFFFYLNG